MKTKSMFTRFLSVAVGALALIALALAPAASGITMDWVPVGNPGAAADNTGFGYVNYSYNIGKYEVTWTQYHEFLTAVATTSDPYGLWYTAMGEGLNGGITRAGTGPYTYTVKSGFANRPMAHANWYTAARFANWMTSGNTESGTYPITGGGPFWTAVIPSATQRAAWASAGEYHVLVPSEDEWYKAAYHKNVAGGGSANYWGWANMSETSPTHKLPASQDGAPNGSANDGFCNAPPWDLQPTTDVGAYSLKPTVSAYGTFDQQGNVNEITDRRGNWGDGWTIRPMGGTCVYEGYSGADVQYWDEQDPWRSPDLYWPTGIRLAYVGTAGGPSTTPGTLIYGK